VAGHDQIETVCDFRTRAAPVSLAVMLDVRFAQWAQRLGIELVRPWGKSLSIGAPSGASFKAGRLGNFG